MHERSFTRALVISVILCILAVGCSRQAVRKPVPGAPSKEPTVLMYINQTGEKKKIKLEDYVAGVVASEMEPTWPVSALGAQAILARTFTMESIQSGRIRKLHGTDVSTSVEESQAYDPSRINDNVRRAVALTRGEVITYRGNYIKAWFNACDGGVSASAAEGLSYTKTPTPYLRAGVKDNCLSITTPANRHWETRIPLAEVRLAVKKIAGQDPGTITRATIIKRGPSGRAEKMKLGNVTVGGPALRLALGNKRVRSTLFSDITIEGDNLVLKGRGYGHGVGMCQWGARLLAEGGRSPRDIIKFYFRDVEIRKLWK